MKILKFYDDYITLPLMGILAVICIIRGIISIFNYWL